MPDAAGVKVCWVSVKPCAVLPLVNSVGGLHRRLHRQRIKPDGGCWNFTPANYPARSSTFNVVRCKCPVVDGSSYIDTSCLLVMKSAFQHMIAWVLSVQDHAAVMDQQVWNFMKKNGASVGFHDRPTVAYRTRHATHYRLAGEAPPPEAIDRFDPHGERYQ